MKRQQGHILSPDRKKDLQEILSLREEEYGPGYKSAKGRFTFLLGGNV
jgi:hypothetical protein